MTLVAAPPALISVFDLFTIGIGPSSSHTVGPMRAARLFAESLEGERVDRIKVELFGSLGATARGHGTLDAIRLGLAGARPEELEALVAAEPGPVPIEITLRGRERLAGHPNAMRFTAGDSVRTFRSIGGGFITEDGVDVPLDGQPSPYPFASAAELLEYGLPISDVALANECARRPEAEVRAGLLKIWRAMQSCVHRGCTQEGILPGGLSVPRRAAALRRKLLTSSHPQDPLRAMDWIQLYALAVNEENAAGGRVVTAPTNGAAGIVPAVLHYYRDFAPGADDEGVIRFLLVAGAIGSLYKRNASISGAEVGCQGEVGSASSMAAAGLAEALGGTPAQVETAAEIAMEHNLGLTCDPVAGLVQIPCIERNALAAVKAVAATRLALHGDGTHHVSLDTVIKTMRDTGAEMSHKYKETSEGGLAVNVPNC
jgi:L-serine dehydratase